MRVSVITACLNSIKTIEQTILSVMGQNYENIEHIIVDGGSTDGTLDVIRYYSERNGNIKWISEPDRGIYDAMNKGLMLAGGEVIGILNSDDWYEKNAIIRVVNRFAATEADMIYGRIRMVYSNGFCRIKLNPNISEVYYQMPAPHPASFIKREVYNELGNFDIHYGIAADYEMLLRIYTTQKKIVELPEVLTNFRENGASRKNLRMCAEETREISYRYLKCFPQICNAENIEKVYQGYLRIAERDDLENRIKNLPDVTLIAQKKKIFGVRDVYLFGAGLSGAESNIFLRNIDVKVRCFWDNDRKKKGTCFCDIPVDQPSNEMKGKIFILIATKKYKSDIENNLRNLGYEEGVDFLGMEEFKDRLLEHI